MIEQLRRLVELQLTDLRLLEIERKKTELPQLLQDLEEGLRQERQALEEAKAKYSALGRERRKKERELDAETERLKKQQRRLFEVKTNREYQALLKEIEQTKEANGRLEEEIILLLERLDEQVELIKRKEEEVKEKEKEVEQRRVEIHRQLEEFDQEVQTLQEKRARLIPLIDAQWIAHYEKILSGGNGPAVVRAVDGTCQGCYLSMPPQMFNEIIGGSSIILCPHCFRFLYYEKKSVDKATSEKGLIGN